MQVVGEVDGDEAACGRWIDRHVVRGVVEELCPRVALDVMRVVVTPPQLDVDPVLGGGGAIVLVLLLVKEAGLRHLPLEGSEQQDVCAA